MHPYIKTVLLVSFFMLLGGALLDAGLKHTAIAAYILSMLSLIVAPYIAEGFAKSITPHRK